MTLPIRRLPFLVIELILQTMGFIDLFLLTRTSAKMKRVVQNMHRTQKHYLFVTIQEPLLIQIQSKANLEYVEEIKVNVKKRRPRSRCIFNMKIGSMDRFSSAFYSDDDGSIGLDTYCTDTKAGCIALCNDLVEVFRTPIRGVILNLLEVENYQNEINWVNSTFPGLSIFRINGKCNFQDYTWIIRNSRATEALKFEMEPTDYPGNTESLQVVPLRIESIGIDHGRWIRLQQLGAIKARSIVIEDASLTDLEINMFLKNLQILNKRSVWKKVEFIFCRESNPGIVLVELNVTEEEPGDAIQQWSFGIENGDKCTIIYAEYESGDPNRIEYGYEILIGN